MTFENYDAGNFYDEMFLPDGSPRPEARQLVERIEGLPDGELVRRHQAAERSLLHTGITFTVYGDEAGTERIFPFDIVPRIVSRETWDPIERGLKQRAEALNLFIDDVYHDRKIVRDGIVPADIVESSEGYRTECIGLDPPRGVWCHITGTDLVRDADGTIYVLEDNLRCPSGVSYVLENRAVMTATFPLFEGLGVRPVIDYPSRRRALSDAHAFFEHVRRSSHLIEGTKNETMEHAEAWHFSRIGRFIERADQTTRILDVKYFLLLPSADDVGKPIDDLQWGALLRSASAFEAYRRTHGRVAAQAVASFLLLNREFPRSVHHCANEAQISLHAVTGTPIRRFANAAERALGRLVAELDYTDIADVVRSGLHDFLDATQDKLNGVGQEITHTFFAQRWQGESLR